MNIHDGKGSSLMYHVNLLLSCDKSYFYTTAEKDNVLCCKSYLTL